MYSLRTEKNPVLSSRSGNVENNLSFLVLIDLIEATGHLVITVSQVFASTGENQFRKPSTCMWDLFAEKFNNGVEVSNFSE